MKKGVKYVDGLVQDCSNSIANALELLQSCTKPSISGNWINIKMPSYQYRKSHCGDMTILRPSYLHNGISYTDKTFILNQGPDFHVIWSCRCHTLTHTAMLTQRCWHSHTRRCCRCCSSLAYNQCCVCMKHAGWKISPKNALNVILKS